MIKIAKCFFSNVKVPFPKILPYTTQLSITHPEPIYVNIYNHDSEHKPKILTRTSGQAAEFENTPDGPTLQVAAKGSRFNTGALITRRALAGRYGNIVIK